MFMLTQSVKNPTSHEQPPGLAIRFSVVPIAGTLNGPHRTVVVCTVGAAVTSVASGAASETLGVIATTLHINSAATPSLIHLPTMFPLCGRHPRGGAVVVAVRRLSPVGRTEVLIGRRP